ncbi:hypothetical protein NTD80_05395 [Pseudomonas sp. 13B_2.1_Bac1]|uniref:DUF6932 family protein n=1 Tax=Pseudomonas sp. 13B_2.1_Bac1 TaxID=2971624 RepID=UPI0021C86EB9|nr:hypothetical protein [Pseudomonas sp. 13B_2.1_Bac1]MCU1782184.1 hypothetical protein [Pseudomonas sp. 13B_2.1_Bac1]
MTTSIPAFNEQGFLPEGIHTCSGSEFIEKFCSENEIRQNFRKAAVDIFDFAASRNANYVFIGGSFITEKKDPHDLDALIVLKSREHIPTKNERLLISGRRLDVMFCSEDDPKILNAFIHLLQNGRFNQNLGIIQVLLNSSQAAWEIRQFTDDDTYEVIKRAYINRELIELNEPAGVLVTVHGIMSNGGWNTHVLPAASNQGWIVAPYFYGFETPDILLNKGKRKAAVDDFREWIYDIQQTYCQNGEKISVIAHSFGTYLVGAYMSGFEEVPPVTFNTIILTGSILNENYDWAACAGNKVGRVRNEIAPNDQWVKWMPDKKWIELDPLFGRAGVNGFNSDSSILDQPRNNIFDHNNVIKRDVVRTMWMPYLNSNKGAGMKEFFEYLKRTASAKP